MLYLHWFDAAASVIVLALLAYLVYDWNKVCSSVCDFNQASSPPLDVLDDAARLAAVRASMTPEDLVLRPPAPRRRLVNAEAQLMLDKAHIRVTEYMSKLDQSSMTTSGKELGVPVYVAKNYGFHAKKPVEPVPSAAAVSYAPPSRKYPGSYWCGIGTSRA